MAYLLTLLAFETTILEIGIIGAIVVTSHRDKMNSVTTIEMNASDSYECKFFPSIKIALKREKLHIYEPSKHLLSSYLHRR